MRRAARACGLVATIVLLVVATAGCGGDEQEPAEADRGPCIILVNGNKLCGQDAKTYCQQFQAPDIRSEVTCDQVLGRKREPAQEDYENKAACVKDLGEKKCEELNFMTDEEEDQFALEERIVKVVGGRDTYDRRIGGVTLAQGTLTLSLYSKDDSEVRTPSKADRAKICAAVLDASGVQKAEWSTPTGTEPCEAP